MRFERGRQSGDWRSQGWNGAIFMVGGAPKAHEVWHESQRGSKANAGLGDDDAGFLALEFLGGGKLAAEEFNEAAGAWAAVRAKKSHAE